MFKNLASFISVCNNPISLFSYMLTLPLYSIHRMQQFLHQRARLTLLPVCLLFIPSPPQSGPFLAQCWMWQSQMESVSVLVSLLSLRPKTAMGGGSKGLFYLVLVGSVHCARRALGNRQEVTRARSNTVAHFLQQGSHSTVHHSPVVYQNVEIIGRANYFL